MPYARQHAWKKKRGQPERANPLSFGGARRDRTVDLYNAIVALSQLSYGPENSAPTHLMRGGARYKSCLAEWQLRLAVALALVVLDFDLDFQILGVISEIIGLFQGLIALDIGQFVSRQRRLVRLLLGRRLGRRGCRSSRRRGRCRRCRTATAADLHEVLAIMLSPALGAFDRPLVQVVEARSTALAGALSTPARFDHA